MRDCIPFVTDRCLRLLLSFVLFLLLPHVSYAQAKPEPPSEPKPTNYKLVDEHIDKDGNTIRTIQYDQGNKHIRETQIIKNILNVHVPISPDTMDKDSVLILIDKSDHTAEVYYRHKMIRAYKAVFGPRPLDDKKMAGDRCTPEGWFTIKSKNPNSKYDKFMLLNYPNDSSFARFFRLKELGVIPGNAQIGGDVGIHGIWKGGDDMIEKGVGWTDGCIALKNKDIDDLYPFVGVGTRVYIRK